MSLPGAVLKDYASYIKDNMVTELTGFQPQSDVLHRHCAGADRRGRAGGRKQAPGRGDEHHELAKETERQQQFQRRGALRHGASAQREQGVFDDLTTRDQRMMFAVITLAITADTKEQLDSDTEAVLFRGKKHMCQLAVLKL